MRSYQVSNAWRTEMKQMMATAGCILSFAAMSAEMPPIEFKGIRPGTSIDTFMADKRFSCSTEKQSVVHSHSCYAFDQSKESIAGARISMMSAYFFDGKLTSFWVHFFNSGYPQVLDALTQKYGTGEAVSSEIQNRMGAKFDNETVTWRTGNVTMRIEKRARKVSEGVFKFITDEQVERSKSASKANIKDL